MTVEEAARELGVPARTVHYWLASKWLHGRNIRGRIWLIAPSEVERVKQIGRPRRGPPKATRRPPPGEDV
jgi:excisionase family DNA binding protein